MNTSFILSLLQRLCSFIRQIRQGKPDINPSASVPTHPKTASTAPTRSASSDAKTDIHEVLKDFLQEHYDLRYNLLTCQAEIRPLDAPAEETYRHIDQRTLNTLVIEAREHGINCWDKDLARLLQSHHIPNFHPFYHYMEQLPDWDGRDRIEPLAARIDDDPLWVNGFRRWLLGLTAQWMGRSGQCAHTLTPLLISARQGMGKSSFCRLLMPPELRAYYLDKFDLNAKANAEMKLGQFGLINLDEFDRYSNTALATLKNLLQLKDITVRKAYTSYFVQLRRIASFIGTSNQMELLNDPTGSRRFLCIEVTHPIDCSPIDHAQLFAQLKHLVTHGERVWMDTAEETAVQEHNQLFSRLRPEEEVFHQLYYLPEPRTDCEMLTATEIHRTLCQSNPSAMRGITVNHLGRTLAAMGLKRVHTRTGNRYAVGRKE